jgi:hypothetical protein
MRRYFIIAVVSGLVGALSAMYAPTPSAAIFADFEVRVHPGPSSASVPLTCGWHSNACPSNPSTGHALDWGNAAGATVYWRSFGYAQYSPSMTILTGRIVRVTNELCYRARVDLTDSQGYGRGSAVYTHSDTSYGGTVFNISGGSGWTWTYRAVGYTRTTDKSGCPGWIGNYWPAHLHQSDSVTNWTRNSSKYPTAQTCPGANCGTKPITTFGYHQASTYWRLYY